MLVSTLLSLFAFPLCSQATNYCPLSGALYPSPSKISSNTQTQSANALLSSALDNAINGNQSTYGDFRPDTNSFSISVVSANDEDTFFQYHHTAKYLDQHSGGTEKVTADTVFRIGSISKLFTVFALLVQGEKVHFDDPVTAYIPELDAIARRQASGSFDPISQVQWEDVTIGALASQLAGIGRDYGNGDLAVTTQVDWTRYGLPVLNSTDIPICGAVSTQPPCSRDAVFRGFSAHHPVSAPFTNPTYSNAAFLILGYVVEMISGQSYETALQETILNPLSLTHTSTSVPSTNSSGAIPAGMAAEWARPYGNAIPSGGIYSSTSDLAKFARAILKSSLLPPARTRHWLKPHSFTTDPRNFVGAPWEITRVTKDTGIVDLYTKKGSTGQYNSIIVLIPDYNVAFAVLTAGDAIGLTEILSEMIADSVLPLIYKISKDQAAQKFNGMYASTRADNSTMSITVDDGPGLLIKEWTSNGVDVLGAYGTVQGVPVQARMYPTGLNLPASGPNGTGKISFRAVFRPTASASPGYHHREIFNSDCPTWTEVDSVAYGNIGVDDVVFQTNNNDKVIGVEPQALRLDLGKTGQASDMNSRSVMARRDVAIKAAIKYASDL